MNIKQILDKVEEFSNERNYWFVRTDYGKHFDEYYNGGYIGIGWGYITLKDFKTLPASEIKNLIAKKENLDPENSREKSKITAIYNKIERFSKLRKGDIIVVPSRKSKRLAFGEIIDESIFESINSEDEDLYTKRRKVKWIENKGIFELDPNLFRLRINQHSISEISSFAPYIDKIVGSLFKKNDKTHYVLTIEKQDDINFRTLSSLLENIEDILKDINKSLSFNENEEEFFVKMNLQSPGTIEIIKTGGSLAIMAYLLFLTSCGKSHNDISDKDLRPVFEKNEEKLHNTVSQLDTLEIDKKEIIAPFANGK